MSKYKCIGNLSASAIAELPSNEPSITQPEATLSIQQLMGNVIEYQRAYREGSYLEDNVKDVDAFGMIDVDALDLCEIQQLRDKRAKGTHGWKATPQ